MERTVVSSSEGPYDASVLSHCDGVGAPARRLPHPADVLHQSGHVTAVAVTVTYGQGTHQLSYTAPHTCGMPVLKDSASTDRRELEILYISSIQPSVITFSILCGSKALD